MRPPRNLHRMLAAGALGALASCNLLTGAANLSTTACDGCEAIEGGNGGDGSSSGGDGPVVGDAKVDTGTSDGSVEGPGGILDTSFGIGGIVDLDLLVDPSGVAVRSDGRILVVGSSSNQLAALALQPNGSVLTTFGTAGRAIRNQDNSSVGRAVVFDSAGRALVGGSANVVSGTGVTTSYPYVVRFADTGTDGTFGTNGGWRGNGGGEVGTGIVVTTGDGIAMSVTDNNDHKIVSLTVTGDPDLGYGTNGESQVQSVGGSPAGLVRVTDGYVTGGTGSGANGRTFAAAKVSLAGTADNGFGALAKALFDVSVNDSSDTGTAIAAQADGALLVGGDYDSKTAQTRRIAAVARFTSAGAVDTTYGTAGKIDIDLTEPGVTREAETRIVGMFVDSKGRTLLVGSLTDRLVTGGPDRTRAWVGRLRANGTLDPMFGTQGKMILNLASTRVDVGGAAIQPDGKMVVVGRNQSNNRLFLVRIFTTTTL